MKICIIIATHKRKVITTANINVLKPYEIIIVASDTDEVEYYRTVGVHVVQHPNTPLGSKWQSGIDHARKLNADKIVVCGSDDILSKHFLESIVSMNYNFIGLRSWYVFHAEKLYHLDYLAPNNLPLGSARVYSKQFLENIDWKVFDPSIDKLLDDNGWLYAKTCSSCLLIDSPEILAVKGNWAVMNRFNPNHPNVKLVRSFNEQESKQIMKEKFNYEP